MASQERGEGSSSRAGNSSRSSQHVAQQIRDTANDLGERASHAVEGIQGGMENFRERFTNVKDTVVDRTKEYARATDTYVNENPWIAVGIGAGIGLIIGMMISPRSGSRPYG